MDSELYVFSLIPHDRRADGPFEGLQEIATDARHRMAKMSSHGNAIKRLTVELQVPTADKLIEITNCLSPEERGRAEGYLHEADRTTYTVAHALLRLLLSVRIRCGPENLQFSRGPFGKPHLLWPAGQQEFSLSYRRGWIAIAISDLSIGVDLEIHRGDIDFEGIAGIFFSEPEQDYFDSHSGAERERAFFRIWARREALAKATGLGLQELAVISSMEAVVALKNDRNELLNWRLSDCTSTAGYTLALAETFKK